MQYTELTPIQPLADYVHCLWTLRAPAAADSTPDRVLPDGRTEIIINRAAPFCEIGDDGIARRQPNAILAAQMSRFLLIQPTGDVDLVGIRFKATGLAALIGANLDALADQRLDLLSVDSALGGALVDAVMRDDDALSRTQALLTTWIHRSRRRHRPEIFAATTWMRNSAGQCRMEAIASRLGMSVRQFERRFIAEVGMTPKRFARVIRFDALLRAAQSGRCRDWTSLAHAFGFHDQPHFNREFRAIAGQSPTEYARSENLIASLFISCDDVTHFYNPRATGSA